MSGNRASRYFHRATFGSRQLLRAESRSRLGATELRQKVAHGVSRGSCAANDASRSAATEPLLASTKVLPPLRGFGSLDTLTHGSRRGLLSVAAPQLRARAHRPLSPLRPLRPLREAQSVNPTA